MRFVPTPLSPLLANITLHGMEERIKEFARTLPGRKRDNQYALNLIRYADDFVKNHKDLTVVQRCREIISEWLNDMRLELKPSKTRLTHTLWEHKGEKPGFNFLGFNVRQYEVGKYHSKQDFQTLITPSEKSKKVHYNKIAEAINSHKSATQAALVSRLNPIIRGWANYFSTVVSKDTYSDLDNLMYQKLITWVNRRHPNKGKKWVVNKYWHTLGGNNWEFAVKKEDHLLKLLRHSEIPIR